MRRRCASQMLLVPSSWLATGQTRGTAIRRHPCLNHHTSSTFPGVCDTATRFCSQFVRPQGGGTEENSLQHSREESAFAATKRKVNAAVAAMRTDDTAPHTVVNALNRLDTFTAQADEPYAPGEVLLVLEKYYHHRTRSEKEIQFLSHADWKLIRDRVNAILFEKNVERYYFSLSPFYPKGFHFFFAQDLLTSLCSGTVEGNTEEETAMQQNVVTCLVCDFALLKMVLQAQEEVDPCTTHKANNRLSPYRPSTVVLTLVALRACIPTGKAAEEHKAALLEMATACFHRLFVGRRNKNGMTPSQQEGLCVFLYLLKALETGGQGTDGVCAVSSVARAVYQHVTPKAQGETVREVKNLEEIGEMLQHHFAQTECYSILGDTENRLGLAFLETLLAKGKTDTDVFLLDEAIKGDMIKLLFVPFTVTMREDARDSLSHHAMELEESGEENSEGLPALHVQFETSLFTLLLNDMLCALSQLRTRQGPDAENESARITSLIQQLLLTSRLDGQFLHPSQRARYTSTVLQQNWRLLLDASLRGVFQNRVLKNGTPAWMAELIFPFYKSPALYKRGTVNRFIQLLHDWGQGAEMRKTFQAVQRKESATQDQFSVESKACFEKSDPAEEESEYTVNEGDADVNVEEYYRVLNRYKPILHLETCQLIFESCLANVRREQLRQHRVQLSIAEDVLRYMLLTVRKLNLIDSLLEQEEVLSAPAPSDEGDGVGAPYDTIMSVCAAEKDFLSAGRSTEEWKALLETDLFPRLSQLTPP